MQKHRAKVQLSVSKCIRIGFEFFRVGQQVGTRIRILDRESNFGFNDTSKQILNTNQTVLDKVLICNALQEIGCVEVMSEENAAKI